MPQDTRWLALRTRGALAPLCEVPDEFVDPHRRYAAHLGIPTAQRLRALTPTQGGSRAVADTVLSNSWRLGESHAAGSAVVLVNGIGGQAYSRARRGAIREWRQRSRTARRWQ
jgi:hypothetical protein